MLPALKTSIIRSVFFFFFNIKVHFLHSFSLLDILAGRKNKKGLQGTVLINGEDQSRNFKYISGYVVQV